MKKKSSKNTMNRAAELITTVGVGAILSIAVYVVAMFVWSSMGTFDVAAQLNVAILSSVLFGLSVGYRLNDIIVR